MYLRRRIDRELLDWKEEPGRKPLLSEVQGKQRNNEILPIEVKSGSKGSMTSMHLFLKEKGAKHGCRLSMENFSEFGKIKVFPLYAYTNVIE